LKERGIEGHRGFRGRLEVLDVLRSDVHGRGLLLRTMVRKRKGSGKRLDRRDG
jgi:hypothetical protein